jgi:hypothetical protein
MSGFVNVRASIVDTLAGALLTFPSRADESQWKWLEFLPIK